MPADFDISKLPARVTTIAEYAGTKVHHLPDWGGYDDPKKLAVIRQIAQSRGRDPRIAKQAVEILRQYKVPPREYSKQAAALLKWVQTPKNVYYVNEPGERLQDPIYTLKIKMGDCDDLAILLCSFFESIMLPWKLVISGRDKATKQKVRFIEGGVYPKNVDWTHIYCMVGTPPFGPKVWYYCEPTVRGVPLGWDVVDGDPGYIPEMDKPRPGPAQIAKPPPLNGKKVEAHYGSDLAASVASAVAEDSEQSATQQQGDKKFKINYGALFQSVFIGVTISVTTQVILDWIRGTGAYEGHEPGFKKVRKVFSVDGAKTEKVA